MPAGTSRMSAADVYREDGAADVLRTYMRFWAIAQMLEVFAGSLSKHTPWDAFVVILCVALYCFPGSRSFRMLALGAKAANTFVRAPFAWDAEYVASLTDVAALVAVMRASYPANASAVSELRCTMLWQMAIFYFGAAFWKANTSFLNPSYSCSSTYVVQLIDAFVPSTSPDLVKQAVRAAPLMTVVGEGAIGIFLAISPKLGVLLGLLLHTGIALTPPPNNIAGFGVVCCVRYFWAVPAGATRACHEFLGLWGALHLGVGACLMGVTNTAFAGAPSVQTALDGADWPVFAYGVFASLFVRALCIDHIEPTRGKRLTLSPPKCTFTGLALMAAMVFYAFFTIILGLLDAGSPNMFSNLRMSGGSNHLLLPTGLLQEWHASRGAESVFAGGVVRIESSNSTFVNERHPGELTSVLTVGTRAMLSSAGLPARFWNPAVANVVGVFVMPPRAPNALFTRFTVPAYELRRLLRGARGQGVPFEIVYTQLEGVRGDETWRRRGGGRVVKLVEDGIGNIECTVLDAAAVTATGTAAAATGASEACDASVDVALWGEPDARSLLNWLGYGQMWNSYVVLPDGAGEWEVDDAELHCYGS